MFIDPKGTEYIDGYRKIDGFSKIFENEQKKSKEFSFWDDFKIIVNLLFRTKDITKVIESHKQYWFDSFKDFEDKMYSINSHALKRG